MNLIKQSNSLYTLKRLLLLWITWARGHRVVAVIKKYRKNWKKIWKVIIAQSGFRRALDTPWSRPGRSGQSGGRFQMQRPNECKFGKSADLDSRNFKKIFWKVKKISQEPGIHVKTSLGLDQPRVTFHGCRKNSRRIGRRYKCKFEFLIILRKVVKTNYSVIFSFPYTHSSI